MSADTPAAGIRIGARLWVLLASALWLGACATSSVVSDLHETATQSNQEGVALLEQDAFKAAQVRFSSAIGLLEQSLATCESSDECDAGTVDRLRENLAQAYTNRAYTRMHLGRADDLALADADRALELAPTLIEPHQYRAIIAVRSLDKEAAWTEYEFLREHAPAFAGKLFDAYVEAFGPRLPAEGTAAAD